MNDLIMLFNNTFPIKKIKFELQKIKKPWIHEGILKCIIKIIKNKIGDRFIYYKKYKNILTSLIRLSENMYYSSKLNIDKNNSKNTWAILNKLLKPNPNKKNSNSPSSEEFNDYFSNIGEKLASEMNLNDNTNAYSSMRKNNENSLFLSPTYNSKIKYSTDTTDLNMNIIKQIKYEISPILCILFNKSISEGISPIF